MQEGEYMAHCLQLDIVATGPTEDSAVSDLMDLVRAQFDFAVQHDNLDNLLKPAPPEVWAKLARYYSAEKTRWRRRRSLRSSSKLRYESTVCYAA